MTLQIPPEQLAKYKQTARQRWLAQSSDRAARREAAWKLARQAADVLRQRFGLEKVVVFGSLTQPDRFTPYSDIDIAAWGLTAANWLKASGVIRLLGENENFEINLVDAASCSDVLLAAIERDGVSV